TPPPVFLTPGKRPPCHTGLSTAADPRRGSHGNEPRVLARETGKRGTDMQAVAELVSKAQQGDQMAFASIYEQYSPLVYRFLRRRLDGSDEVVEDLTEDVFVKVYEKLDRYVERGLPFTAWLYRIAHNHLVDYLRTLPRLSATS